LEEGGVVQYAIGKNRFEQGPVTGLEVYPKHFAAFEPDTIKGCIDHFNHAQVAIAETTVDELCFGKICIGKIAIDKTAAFIYAGCKRFEGIIDRFELLVFKIIACHIAELRWVKIQQQKFFTENLKLKKQGITMFFTLPSREDIVFLRKRGYGI
jgi:hypothetical protein